MRKKAISAIILIFILSAVSIFMINKVHGYKNKEKPENVIVQNNISNWQLISRLRYIQGEIALLKKSADGNYILIMKVEANYHSSTDPVDNDDFPFKRGEIVQFKLKSMPKINLKNNDRVIIYEGQVTTDGKNNFLGADIKYYEDKGKYFDLDGKEINIPPKEYPGSL